jgi:flagellar biosynthesis protein FlhA
MMRSLNPTVLMAIALIAVIAMMVLPMPPWLLDLGLVVSFAIAILVFSITLFVEKPLDFSSFPTVLLVSLLLRLSLNVSSTKLIIGQGHTGTNAAGHVIEGFAEFIIGGSVILGLVTFGVLMIVNFVVINKGAARMAEVGARFALDAMPGKQLAIDSDMAAGAITHAEARARREKEQAETTFFGSLDGASKFVKGDAIAGLLITALNLIVGLIMGIGVHGMPAAQAFETYSILTIGDGLVSQIPAVIISVASAMLLARSSDKGAADTTILRQLGQSAAAMRTVSLLMGAFAFVPGLPTLPFLICAGGLFLIAGVLTKRDRKAALVPDVPAEPILPREESIGDILDLDDIHVEFSPDLLPTVLDPMAGLDGRIASIRKFIASSYGIILPEIRLSDNAGLAPGQYLIRIQGVEVARDKLEPDNVLAITNGEVSDLRGTEVKEPVFGAPALWIAHSAQEIAAISGITVVQPNEVLATHLLEVIKQNLGRLLTAKSLKRLMEEVTKLSDAGRSEANRKLISDLVPDRVPFEGLLSVLRLLLDERVSVRNWPLILETLAEHRGTNATPETLCEFVRRKLGFQIIAEFKRDDGSLPLVQLAPEWEVMFTEHQFGLADGTSSVALPPDKFNRLANQIGEKIAKVSQPGTYPAVVVPSPRRRFVRSVVSARGLANPVISYEEIGGGGRPAIVGVVAA